MTDTDIDIVIPWVDGSDKAWRTEFERYSSGGMVDDAQVDAALERYRDWGNLQYLFRGIETFAPWVRRVHLLSCGHLPSWLDASHPKLNVVNHRDFIPSEYLPTFSSMPIELNMHRVKGLAERFIYFNDDIFLCRPVAPERFFRGGLPCDMARLRVLRSEFVDHIMLECMGIVNRRYDKAASMKRHLGKWFNYRYRAGDMVKTLSLMPWNFFPGFYNHHMAQPFLKSTFERLWAEEPEAMARTCRDKFRSPTDVSQWLFRYEQIARGEFAPHGMKDSRFYNVSDSNAAAVASDITGGRYSVVCVNDTAGIDFDAARATITAALDKILPDKSTYEL